MRGPLAFTRNGGRSAPAKFGLLAGAAWLALAASAHAQTPPPADGLGEDRLFMEADQVVRDDASQTATARGEVEVRYRGRTLRADELVYDEAAGVIRARGNTAILNPDGTVEYADEIVLDEEMKAGVATGFAARLPENVKLAAGTAVRRSEQVHELNRAIYTPCDICAPDGTTPKTPTWSIQAERVVQDRERQLVYYRNAWIRVFGQPIAYLPIFWHPDPTAERKSGLLPPKFSASDRRGFSYEQPYVWVVSPHSDITLSPQLNVKVNPFLNVHARKRFYSGAIDARMGYTYDTDFDGQGQSFGDATSRSYILASGAFAIDENWRWGFTAERSSDDLLFDKYEIGDVYESRGPYIADDRRLISQAYATRQDQQSWFSAAAFTVQGLRPGDNERTFPVAAPLVEARYEPTGAVAGGRLRTRASAVVLTREQSPDFPTVRLPGLDSRRATAEADWRATYTSAAGLRVAPFLHARFDAYSFDDNMVGVVGVGPTSRSVSRGLGVAGVDVTYPFFRRFSDFTAILEPIVQLAASPDLKQIELGRNALGQTVYLNEDAIAFEFDETNLFRANKFPGYDLYEDGVRVNVGGRASVFWDDGRRASLLVGRSFRDAPNEIFAERTGLRDRASDWIVAADAQPLPGVRVFTRARLDGDSLDVERAEAGANVYTRRASGYFRYLRSNTDINGDKTENFDVGGELYLTKNWGVTVYGNRDLVQEAWVIRDIGVVYRDECTRVDIIYRREDTVIGRLGPSDSVTVRLTLATLGEPLYGR